MTDRQTKILQIVNEQKRVEVTSLSELLDVSQVTIRKDLDVLEERGLLIREHGYAAVRNTDDITNRLSVRYDTKLKIAKAAAKIVATGKPL